MILTIGELLEPYENIRKYIRKKGGGRERGGRRDFFSMGEGVHRNQNVFTTKLLNSHLGVFTLHISDN